MTLVELMVVLALAAIALGLAAPDLGALVRAQQLKAAGAELFAAVGLARAQALARGQIVVLAPLDPAGLDWRGGWSVFVDRDGDGRPGPGDERILEHGPVARGITVDFAFTSPAPPEYIAYNGAGRGCGAANGAQARWGTLSLFGGADSGGAVRRIKINMLGRARLCDPAPGPGRATNASSSTDRWRAASPSTLPSPAQRRPAPL
jgi:type IV fimbrial biogenesis protein FimT